MGWFDFLKKKKDTQTQIPDFIPEEKNPKKLEQIRKMIDDYQTELDKKED